MSWEAVVRDEQATNRILTDHAVRIGQMENAAFEHSHLSFGVSYRQGYRKGFREAVAWVLHMQAVFSKLPPAEQIAEFDKGPGSLYYPMLMGDQI